jgi:hypothetical protein
MPDRNPRLGSLCLAFILLVAFAWVAATPIPALADCENSGNINWAIEAAPNLTVSNARGQRGRSDVRPVSLTQGGSPAADHVESMYIFGPTASSWIEFGWSFDYPGVSTYGPYVFDARSYNGDTTLARDDSAQAPINNSDHSFAVFYDTSDSKWHFRVDGDLKSFTRANSPFTNGHPNAGGELRNHCDDGNSHWYNLARQKPDNSWVSWPDNHYICDLELHHGYSHVADDEFQILHRTDTFMSNDPPTYTPNAQSGSCNPFHA